MSVPIKTVVESFELLFGSLLDQRFCKTLRLHEWKERDLLPLVRTFLLGYFGESIVPEARATLPGSLSGRGRIDFVVDGVAVEFAVRRPEAPKATLSLVVNSTEVKKLMKFDGPAILVLFDFSSTPFEEHQLESFRDWPSLGKGNHKKSPFNVAYFYVASKSPKRIGVIRKNVRVAS